MWKVRSPIGKCEELMRVQGYKLRAPATITQTRPSISLGWMIGLLGLLLLLSSHCCFAQEPAADTSAEQDQPKPAWVEHGSFVDGDDEYVLVKTDSSVQFAKHYQALMAIEPAMKQAVAKQLDKWFGAGAGEIAAIEDSSLLEPLVQHSRYVETYKIQLEEEYASRFETDSEEFYRGYALLKFDSEFRATAKGIWNRNLTRNRLIYAGVIGAGLLGILGVIYGFLHFNHLTRGFYVGRLQTISVVLVLLILVVSYFLARTFVPQ